MTQGQRNCAARRYLPLGARCATVFSQKVPKLGAKIFKTLIKSRSIQISSWNILWVLWGPMRTQPWKKFRQKFSSKFFVKFFFSSNHFQISQGAYTKNLSKIGRLNPKLFAKNCPIWHLRGDILGLHNLFVYRLSSIESKISLLIMKYIEDMGYINTLQ